MAESLAPTAISQQVVAQTNTPTAITLAGSDPDGNALTFAVVAVPGHGTLTGTPPNVTYTPATDYSGSDSFTFTVSDGNATSAPATVALTIGGGSSQTSGASLQTGGWSPPIGIPMPPFGIKEAHTMYAGQQWNYGSGSEPYRDAGSGPYTHYIDNADAQSSDLGNAFGTPDRPRKTIPEDLPAGSVVEVHGGPYKYTIGGAIPLGGSGTAAKPIFIRGISATARPQFNQPVVVRGQYVIVENIDVKSWSAADDSGVSFNGPVHHAALRHSEVRNGPSATTTGVPVGGSSDTSKAEYIVIYHNAVHDNGDWRTTHDEDHHGIGVFEYSQNVWILDNEIYRNSGDGIQLNAGEASRMTTLHHVYVGRNLSWQNKQTGMWTKSATDVVFSQNTIHSHRPSDSSSGAGCGWQYGPERVWFLFNRIYDCETGIGSASVSGPGGDGTGMDVYLIGNVIYDIHRTEPGGGGPWKNGAAISLTDENARKHIVNNTVYDTDAGLLYARGDGPVFVANNIFASVKEESVWVERDEAASASVLSHSLFDPAAQIIWGDRAAQPLGALRAELPALGAGCAEAAPQFASAATGDFHVQASGAARDGGVTDSVYGLFQNLYGLTISVDFDSVARPQGVAFDVGAFERTP